MAIWEPCTVTGNRIDVDEEGTGFVRILSPSFRRNDGNDFTFIGFGNRLIIPTLEAYKFYKFELVAIREVTGDPSWQIAEFRLYHNGELVSLSGAVATNPGGDGGLNPEHPEEGPSSAIDGSTASKFLDHLLQPLVVEFPGNTVADAWSYVTGNDSIERDPVQWRIWGSRDGSDWVLLQEQLEDFEVTEDREEEVGPFSFYPED